MQFTTIALATLLSATSLAAPTPAAAAKSAVADVPEWTFEGFKRVCDGADTSCTWSFTIDTHLAATTPCSFVVKAGAKPASQTDSAGNVCVATLVNGGVTVISPDGELVDFVETGDLLTTNVCFGGEDLTTAYITLSTTGRLVKTTWPRPGLGLTHLND